MRLFLLFVSLALIAAGIEQVTAQETSTSDKTGTGQGETKSTSPVDTEDMKKKAKELVEDTKVKVDELAEKVNKSEKAKEYSAGILKPIYQLAEKLSIPAFHWVAFSLMVTGVISYGLQLVLGKLVVLSKLGLSFTEILSDTLGLAISVIGLVLTTQAAAENSDFTGSPFAVLSATGVGLLAGIVFYVWGQSQEVQAVEGRREKK